MSRSRNTRHKWKRKERSRTHQSDPAKIHLHRERFVKSLEGRTVGAVYHPAVFSLRVQYDPESYETTLLARNEDGWAEAETVPFLAEDLADLKPTIQELFPEIDMDKEAERLRDHVSRIKATKQECQMQRSAPELNVLMCQSAVACKYRRYDEDLQAAICCR